MNPHYVVAGAGGAGLSLAHRLAETDLDFSMTLIESRSEYQRDRTWCLWPIFNYSYQDCVVVEWPSWTVEFNKQTVRHTNSETPYQMIDSGLFYDKTRKRIAEDQRFQLHLDQHIDEVKTNQEGIWVETPSDEWTGDYLFDTRPPDPAEGSLIQHFLGWEVISDQDVFNADAVTLMDFWSPSENGVHFVYVLPRSTNRALVEVTWISLDIMDKQEYVDALERYLDEKLGIEGYDIEYEEFGVIPLESAFQNHHSQRTIALGNRGGATRPSTGYTFQGIQRQVSGIVEQLTNHQRPAPVTVWGPRALFLDAVFMRLLKHRPNEAAGVFFNLFDGTNSDQLVRFLTGQSRPSDLATVLGSMPTWSMIKQSAQYFFRGL